jgi:hypothetical protein
MEGNEAMKQGGGNGNSIGETFRSVGISPQTGRGYSGALDRSCKKNVHSSCIMRY